MPSRRDYGPVAGSRGQRHNKNPRYIKKDVRGKSDKGKETRVRKETRTVVLPGDLRSRRREASTFVLNISLMHGLQTF